MPSGVKPVPTTPVGFAASAGSAGKGISLMRVRLPFSPSVPPKSCSVVQMNSAFQNAASFHFFHSPSPFVDMSITTNLPAGTASVKPFNHDAFSSPLQPTKAHPWKDQIASGSVRFTPMYAAAPRVAHNASPGPSGPGSAGRHAATFVIAYDASAVGDRSASVPRRSCHGAAPRAAEVTPPHVASAMHATCAAWRVEKCVHPAEGQSLRYDPLSSADHAQAGSGARGGSSAVAWPGVGSSIHGAVPPLK